MLSKLGAGSRTEAARWVAEGRVRVNGSCVRDAEFPVRVGIDRVSVDGRDQAPAGRLVLMLNKPRGLVTTTKDHLGRDTVYRCLRGSDLPWMAPVGRLDKASEGLLLFTNDPEWAASVTDPATGPHKTYHVQIDRPADAVLLAALEAGTIVDGDFLRARTARRLRGGTRTSWLELILDEGRNRHIRRLLSAFDASVLRLVRVAIGALPLGGLAKGRWRLLTPPELLQLTESSDPRRVEHIPVFTMP